MRESSHDSAGASNSVAKVEDYGLSVPGQFPEMNDEISGRDLGALSRAKEWIGTHKTKLIIGVAATSLAVTLTTNPVSELKDSVLDAAPWVAPGVVGSEVAFAAGAAMMLGAVGSRIGNPLKIKQRIPEIAERANDSKMFKAGFWINATGAVGDFAVISAGVLKEMPPSSYPLLSLTLLDLAGTIAVRKGVADGIKNNKDIETFYRDESGEL